MNSRQAEQIFKDEHRNLDSSFYASDVDLVLVDREGPLAVLDFKTSGGYVTYTEALLYNYFLDKSLPVYLVYSNTPEEGPFTVYEFLGASVTERDVKVELGPPETLNDWLAYEKWESRLRKAHRTPDPEHEPFRVRNYDHLSDQVFRFRLMLVKQRRSPANFSVWLHPEFLPELEGIFGWRIYRSKEIPYGYSRIGEYHETPKN